MGSIMENIFGTVTNKSADETLAYSAMSAAASSSLAYLGATLESTTPEVRRIFSEYTTQSVMSHEAITGLCIKKGWLSPYETPINQLGSTYTESQSVISDRH